MTEESNGAAVLSLACARTRDQLSEGASASQVRAHLSGCAECASLAADVEEIAASMRALTAVDGLPPGFAEQVLERAEGLIARPARIRAVVEPRRGRYLVVAAAMLAVLGVGGLVGWLAMSPGSLPADVAPRPVTAASTPSVNQSPVIQSPWVPTQQSAPAQKSAAAGFVAAEPAEPLSPRLDPMPMPSVDDLRGLILAQATSVAGCPRHVRRALRLTVTVDLDGTLSNRQLLSAAGQMSAHRCINDALDEIRLASPSEPTTVTLELTW